MLRVLLVVHDGPLPSAAAACHVGRLAAGLVAAGDEVEVVHDVGRRSPRPTIRPDVVHHHAVRRFGSLSSSGAPQVLTVHDLALLDNRWRPLTRRRFDAVLADADGMAGALSVAGFSRITLVPAFAPEPPFEPALPSRSTHVAYVGALTEEAGFGTLAEAWQQVCVRRPDVTLCASGAGPLALLLAALERAEAEPTPQPGAWGGLLADSRVVVLPSAADPSSLGTAVEAALAGRPVVTADRLGASRFVEASGGGLVVPADDPGALAEAVLALLDDPALADRLGAAGRAEALAHHTVAAGIERMRAVYCSLR